MSLLHHSGSCATLVIVVTPSWVGLLAAFLRESLHGPLWQHKSFSLGRWHSGLCQLKGLWVLCLKCMVSSTIGTYLPFCLYGGMGGQLRADAIVCDILGDSLTTLTNNSNEVCACLVLGILLVCLWLLEGPLSTQMRKFHLKHMYIYRELYIISIYYRNFGS